MTHEDEVAQHAKRVIRLRDGEIQFDKPVVDRKVFTKEQIQEIAHNADVASRSAD